MTPKRPLSSMIIFALQSVDYDGGLMPSFLGTPICEEMRQLGLVEARDGWEYLTEKGKEEKKAL